MFALALENDPAGNALAFMAWGLVIAVAVSFVISAGLFYDAGQRAPREAATRVRRRIVR